VPEGTFCYPRPARSVPVIVGGMSVPALGRAALAGDGWLALPKPSDDMVDVMRDGIARARGFAAAEGRDLTGWRCILNAHDPLDVAPLLPQLRDLGVTDVVVDLDYDTPDGPERAFEALSKAAG